MSFLIAGAAVVSAGIGVANAIGANRRRKDAEREEAIKRVEMDRLKSQYRNLDTSNPYLNMENTMEDLTVNQQQAQFEAQQGQQQRANIMDQMRSAAGGSGIAALAQQMAQSGQLASQRASASIGQQEAANQRAAAQEASRLQGMERQGEVISRNLQRDQTSTLLGMSQSEVAAERQKAALAEQQKYDAMAGVADSAMSGITAGVDAGLWG
tara:strand:- start:1629 stop:2261 length:633 start_codon:yes stop_codon:yes gene_type:complete